MKKDNKKIISIRRNRLSLFKFLSVSLSLLAIIAIIGRTTATYAATNPVTVTFDFDSGSPILSTGKSTPFEDTSDDVTAQFSSSADPAGFSIQSYDTTFYKLAQFSGKYLLDSKPSRDNLTIRFNQPLSSINFTFATLEYSGAPGVPPTNISLTAYIDSTVSTPIGTVFKRGVWPSGDFAPQGTLSFDAGSSSFNLVVINIPYQGPMAAIDFFIDNITVTAVSTIPEFPYATILPLLMVISLIVGFIRIKRNMQQKQSG